MTEAETELFREAHELLINVNIFTLYIPREKATQLHTRLRTFQNEHRDVSWTSVRLIHNRNLYLVESGLWLYLRRGHSPTEGYQLAAFYCEHYDPRYGNGLNGHSVERIEEIVAFVRAFEAHEQAEQERLPSAHEAV